MTAPRRPSFAPKMAAATLSRAVINTGRRFAYPFAAALGAALGVPLAWVTSAVAAGSAMGISSPAFGPLGDLWGHRRLMLCGLGIMGAGMLAAGVFSWYGAALAAIVLAGLAKAVFDPSLQAWVGERVPFHRRGWAVGIVELAWSISALAGIPLAGLLMQAWGVRAPFLALGALALGGAAALFLMLPPDKGRHRPAGGIALGEAWGAVRASRAALGAMAFGLLASLANDAMFITYGLWLHDRFSLGIAALGIATTVIGVAELLGEGLTSLAGDRLGLVRALVAGVGLSTVSYALLPALGGSLTTALLGLFLVFLSYEFSIVVSLSLCTEVVPGARATMMSAFIGAMGVGRVVGALLGGPLWLAGGIGLVAVTSVALSLAAGAAVLWGFWRWQPATGSYSGK